MADITMCRDEDCPKKDTCYRFTAIANEWRQAYFMKSPRDKDKCNHYWQVKSK